MGKRILAVDPGNVQSAYVVYDKCHTNLTDMREQRDIREHGIYPNADMSVIIKTTHYDIMAIEMIASYGMPVGATVFETCLWIGRFIECCLQNHKPFELVYRKDTKMHLCNSMRAKDSNIRQAIIDRYPAIGGGKTPQVGTKSQPGPLYGVKADIWAALAVAITFAESKEL